MDAGKTDSALSAAGRGDKVAWVNPQDMQELDELVQCLNTLVSGMMALPVPQIKARLADISGLSDAMFTVYPGDEADNARYIRHVDNEDGLNGRLLTCVYYMNDEWNAEDDGGELRIFEGDQTRVKADLSPIYNRLVVFFSDSSVPHEVRHARKDRYAVTIWYINLDLHLAYHENAK